jgi:hypothetical protein
VKGVQKVRCVPHDPRMEVVTTTGGELRRRRLADVAEPLVDLCSSASGGLGLAKSDCYFRAGCHSQPRPTTRGSGESRTLSDDSAPVEPISGLPPLRSLDPSLSHPTRLVAVMCATIPQVTGLAQPLILDIAHRKLSGLPRYIRLLIKTFCAELSAVKKKIPACLAIDKDDLCSLGWH